MKTIPDLARESGIMARTLYARAKSLGLHGRRVYGRIVFTPAQAAKLVAPAKRGRPFKKA